MHVTLYAVDPSGSEVPIEIDASGNLMLGGTTTTKDVRAATATGTAIAAGTASGTILAANASRLGAAIYNESTAPLYLKFGTAAASFAAKSLTVAAGGYYETPAGYVGAITGAWTVANGSANVTEFTA